MQTYNIEIPQSVEDRITEQALFIAQDKPQAAMKWYKDIYNKIVKLEFSPKRCPIAPESQYIDFEVRHLLIKKYRVLFRIVDHTVILLEFKGGKQA